MCVDKANQENALGHARADADSLRQEMRRYSQLACGCSVSMEPNTNKWHTCPLHEAAAAMLEALEGLREDLQTRLNAATEGATEADGLVLAEDVNRSWRSWLFDVMSTHGDIARQATEKAKRSQKTGKAS